MNKEVIAKLIEFLTKAQEIIETDGETCFSMIRKRKQQEIGRIFAELFPSYSTDGDSDYSTARYYHNFNFFEVDITFFSHCDSFDEILDDPYKLAVEIYRKNDRDIEGIDDVLDFLNMEFKTPVQMVNLTPHEITVFDTDGVTVLDSIPSSGIARAKQIREPIGHVNGITIYQTSYGDVAGLPVPQNNTIYIVSIITAQAVPNRSDVYIIDDLVRDENGVILGCKALAKI